MAKSAPSFVFNENSELDANFDLFVEHLTKGDAKLGAALDSHRTLLIGGGLDQATMWNALYAATATASPPLPSAAAPAPAQPAQAVAATSQSSSPPSPVVPSITGWLLEGLSIEGFRGVNNQGHALELSFKPNSVNSVSAVNGVGKSSIHDAVRYAITGRLPWLDDLPATERDVDYYLNRFNTSGKATIKLKLVAEPNGEKCEVTVVRDAQGNRTVTASGAWDGDALLRSLDREFVFLDGPTFQKFIADRPLVRGRTFSGLLGLSAYSDIRQMLAGLANTRAFSNHFDTTAHAHAKAREDKAYSDAQAAITVDFEALVGTPLATTEPDQAQAACCHALVQIAPLKPLCDAKPFDEIDIDACIDAIKEAEGGPRRERLAACMRERGELSKLNLEAPDAHRAARLVLVEAVPVANPKGDALERLFRPGLQRKKCAHDNPQVAAPGSRCASRCELDLTT